MCWRAVSLPRWSYVTLCCASSRVFLGTLTPRSRSPSASRWQARRNIPTTAAPPSTGAGASRRSCSRATMPGSGNGDSSRAGGAPSGARPAPSRARPAPSRIAQLLVRTIPALGPKVVRYHEPPACGPSAPACPSPSRPSPVPPAQHSDMSTVIDSLESALLRRAPTFAAGDRVRVHFQVVEGTRRRTQVFEGVVIKRQGHGARETFTVRKQSFGVGVERTFPLHSPKIERIEIAARGDVRRAKLYYLRGRVGKRARVRERRNITPEAAVERGLVNPAAAADGAPTEEAIAEAELDAVEAGAGVEPDAAVE